MTPLYVKKFVEQYTATHNALGKSVFNPSIYPDKYGRTDVLWETEDTVLLVAFYNRYEGTFFTKDLACSVKGSFTIGKADYSAIPFLFSK